METNVRRRHGWLVVVYTRKQCVWTWRARFARGLGETGWSWFAVCPWGRRGTALETRGEKGRWGTRAIRCRKSRVFGPLSTHLKTRHKAGGRVGARVDTGCGKPPFCS